MEKTEDATEGRDVARVTPAARPLNLNRLFAFHAVARLGSMARAARHLGVTQPTISEHMTALERELGTTLLERQKFGSALTPAGQAAYRRATEVVEAVGRLVEEVGRRAPTPDEKYADPEHLAAEIARLGRRLEAALASRRADAQAGRREYVPTSVGYEPAPAPAKNPGQRLVEALNEELTKISGFDLVDPTAETVAEAQEKAEAHVAWYRDHAAETAANMEIVIRRKRELYETADAALAALTERPAHRWTTEQVAERLGEDPAWVISALHVLREDGRAIYFLDSWKISQALPRCACGQLEGHSDGYLDPLMPGG